MEKFSDFGRNFTRGGGGKVAPDKKNFIIESFLLYRVGSCHVEGFFTKGKARHDFTTTPLVKLRPKSENFSIFYDFY